MTARVVYFEETNESREVVGRCQVCWRSQEAAWPSSGARPGVVSPSGIEHICRYERTVCGHDATGDKWWWPL